MKSLYDYRGVLFDLDGVLTPTSVLHRQAWKSLFDEVLPSEAKAYGPQDYLLHVDGKPRYDGVYALLKSRGIEMPWGSSSDSPDMRTVCGLGNRKNAIFEDLLHSKGIAPYPDVVDVLRHLRAAHIKIAVVSSSRNALEVLRSAHILGFFDKVVDGHMSEEGGLKGKPQPDTYLHGAKLIGEAPKDCVVVEDALSGVAAGHAGNFGLVVGVDRGAGRESLLAHGADVVVDQLAEMLDGDYGVRSKRTSTGLGADPLSNDQYPIDPWRFTQIGIPDASSATMFSVSNGYVGVRGGGDSSRCLGYGTFLSGFHETFAIKHAEDAYGYARVGQTIQGVPDFSDFRYSVKGYELGDPASVEQTLDFRNGVTLQKARYALDNGGGLDIELKRMACLFRKDLVVYALTVHAENQDVSVRVSNGVNAEVPKRVESNDPRKSDSASNGGLDRLVLGRLADSGASASADGVSCQAYRCHNSQMTMAVAADTNLDGVEVVPDYVLDVKAGESRTLVRYVSYNTYSVVPTASAFGLAVVDAETQDPEDLARQCQETVHWAQQVGFNELLVRQKAWLDDFWARADIRIESDGDERIQQLTRWELFNLAQCTAFVNNGVGAKGLSGSGYSGHYFWDTEIFILPFLTYTQPKAARAVLEFRYRMLPAARSRADALGLPGALYPWRTINGREASAFFAAGTAQYHIDADIAYAVSQYVQVTKDVDFLRDQGIDILVETARMWYGLGHFSSDRKFHINCVTGPDEYSAMVNDNYYTNIMARFNLRAACTAIEYFRDSDPAAFDAIVGRDFLSSDIHGGNDEWERWREAADAMTLPKDHESGVDLQDDGFMQREAWDFEHRTERPLLLHYHPLDIYRHKVLKQSDLVLATYLLSDEFDKETKRLDFDYYDALTTGDSSLSSSSQSIMAAEVGHGDLAMRYFREALFADVANLHGNTEDGLHLACAGGIWETLVAGFGGFRDSGGHHMVIDPRLPRGWRSLSYQLRIDETLLKVIVSPDDVKVERLSGDPVALTVKGRFCEV